MQGRIHYITTRPERRADVVAREEIEIDIAEGIVGDHPTMRKRQVTIISKEHLDDVAERLGVDAIDPGLTRRNIVISGMDFEDLKGEKLALGEAEIEITGYCHPCQRMEENLGEGGRLAMARKAGWTARVIKSGKVRLGDSVAVITHQKSSL